MHDSLLGPINQGYQSKSRVHRYVFGFFMIATFAILCVNLYLTYKLQSKIDDASDHVITSLTASSIPNKFGASYVPPRKFQYVRGTCWDFGTIGPIEHQYRLQGISKGYLQPNEYVRLSEQAYGNLIIKYCQENRAKCLFPTDRVAYNSTEGGEVTLLWTFQNEFQNSILPDSVCPYIQRGDNSSCPALDDALSCNPIQFTIKSFSNLYDVASIKQQLYQKKYAMPISVPVHMVSYYLPCNDKYADKTSADCQAATCQPCPLDSSFSSQCCQKIPGPMYNMEGEFRKHHALDLEAGHAMTLVGYNDEFVTKDGMKGGFIMRNTWKDGVYSFDEFGQKMARGSHSLAYFMGLISEMDERIVCPNSFNPRNWLTCGGDPSGSAADKLKDCSNPDTNTTAYLNRQALHLTCQDTTGKYCTKNDDLIYYALNTTIYGDGLHRMCFLQASKSTGVATDLCNNPTPLDVYATIYIPVDAEVSPNDDDFCGYYIFPYDLYREAKATFSSGFVTDYDLEFTDSSFARSPNRNPNKCYQYVESSTLTQKGSPDMANPYPLPTDSNPMQSMANSVHQRIALLRQKISL